MIDSDKIIAEILQKALLAAEQTGDFLSGQVPDIINQLLIYKLVQNGFCVLIGVAALCFAYLFYKKTNEVINKEKGTYHNDGWEENIGAVISILFSTISGLALFLIGGEALIKIIFAPKIYLIEYAVSLVK